MAMAPRKRGQHDQQEGYAINAEIISGANGGNPGVRRALHELEARKVFDRPEPADQRQRYGEAEEGEDVGNPADCVFALAGNE